MNIFSSGGGTSLSGLRFKFQDEYLKGGPEDTGRYRSHAAKPKYRYCKKSVETLYFTHLFIFIILFIEPVLYHSQFNWWHS